MSFSEYINGESPATGAVALYSVYTMLALTGATKVKDSDATTYSSSGATIVSGASGATGLGNTSAWMVIRLSNGVEYCYQRGSNNTFWRIKYSASAGFSGGSPGATRVPSATDEALILGGGTDASPTYSTLWSTDAAYKLYAGTGTATDGFWVATAIISGGAASGGFWHDPVTGARITDADPHVNYLSSHGSSCFAKASIAAPFSVTTASRCSAWLANGLGGAGFVGMPGLTLAENSSDVFPNSAGANAHDGGDDLYLIPYARRSSNAAPIGNKGTSKFAAWNGTTRTARETFTVSTLRDRICFGDVNLPWGGDVVL